MEFKSQLQDIGKKYARLISKNMRLHLNQPNLNKKILEYQFKGRLVNWILKKLGFIATGTTFTFPYIAIIIYLVNNPTDLQFKALRCHEMEHVFQSESNVFLFWIKYIWYDIVGFYQYYSISDAYYNNKYEKEAYDIQNGIIDGSIPLPEWAK